MRKKLVILGFLFSCVVFSSNAFALEPFNEEVFSQIKAKNLNKQWLLILWSVDCPPCFKELELVQKLRAENQLSPVVIINVDDNDESAEQRAEIISQFQLGDLPNYYFKDGQGDVQRYLIDSQWYGELPRSYFIERNGEFHGKSGLLSEKLLINWLVETD